MTLEANAEADLPDPSPLVALSFLTPWAIVSAFLPDPWRMAGFGLVTALAVLLLAAAGWSYRRARAFELDASHWAFVTVLTLGFAMIALAFTRTEAEGARTYVCMECGWNAHVQEPFCYRCGAA